MKVYTKEDAQNAPEGHRRIVGTDLEIVDYLQGDDMTVIVNKGGVAIMRVKMLDATKAIDVKSLSVFGVMPDIYFRVGDAQEGVQRSLKAAGFA